MTLSPHFDEGPLNEFLVNYNLAAPGESPVWTRLAGGVSSDIWRVDLGTKTICVKRALPSLKVTAEWHAPVIRNHYEWEWLNFVYRKFPDLVPEPLAHDPRSQILAWNSCRRTRTRCGKLSCWLTGSILE